MATVFYCLNGAILGDKEMACWFPVYACRANMIGIDIISVLYFQAA